MAALLCAAALALAGCAAPSPQHLLAVGGVHALEGTEPCHLEHVEPPAALKDLAWKNALVVRAENEGHAELACGGGRRGGFLRASPNAGALRILVPPAIERRRDQVRLTEALTS